MEQQGEEEVIWWRL